jgi:DNA-binding transcriptional regulator YhcF (GntR family)
MKRPQPTPSELLIDRVRRHLAEQGWSEGQMLPPQRYWTQVLGISFAEASALFKHLERQGEVRIVGRRGVFVGPSPGADTAHSLAQKLKESISQGDLRTGEPLPSYKELQALHHVGPITVAAAMRLLMEWGLAHKKGKKYLAGRMPVERGGGTLRMHVKHIMVTPPSSAYFERILDQTSPFSEIMHTFLHEVSRFAVDIHTVPLQGWEFDRTLRRGRSDVRTEHARLEADIIAYLYISNSSEPAWKPEDIYSSLFFLREFGRPVVWLDLDNLHARERRHLPPQFSVVGDCTEEAARSLCRYLFDRGHRHLAFCIPWYVRERAQPLAEVMTRLWQGQSKGCELAVHVGDGPCIFESINPDNYCHHKGIPHYVPRDDAVQYLRQHGLPFVRRFLGSRTTWRYIYRREAYLMENSPLLARLHASWPPTATQGASSASGFDWSACAFPKISAWSPSVTRISGSPKASPLSDASKARAICLHGSAWAIRPCSSTNYPAHA